MKVATSSNEYERLAFAHAQLKDILLRHMPEPGVFVTRIPDVGMARRDTVGFSEHRFDRPLVSLLVQGSKETVIGANEHKLEPGQILTVCMDMPSSSRILTASLCNPLLTFYFYINPRMIKELMLELDGRTNQSQHVSGILVTWADVDFMEAMLRLASIIDKPEQLPVRAEIALKDLYFLLLTGMQANALKEVYATGGNNNSQLFAAITYLKEHLDRVIRADELAKAANMSESSLYRHFKMLTGITPLQYHKQLRLHQARDLIMTEHEQAATVAYRVGYESVSKFSRDYKKMFGLPPKRSKKQS